MSSKDFFQSKSILICCGSGGVGKTSISAALALKAARMGKKSIVITIDPAKRLTTSLGVKGITDKPKNITAIMNERLTEPLKGEISALMLDAKGLFDRTILKNSPSKALGETILNNRIYKILSSQSSGTQEYMAVQQLLDVYESHEYEVIILDTPPTRHALDFLNAPNKMIEFLDEKVIGWFGKPIQLLRGDSSNVGFTSRLFTKGSQIAFRVFETLVSSDFVEEFIVFIRSIFELSTSFKDMATTTQNLLKNELVGFILISSPNPTSLRESEFFLKTIQEKELPFMGYIVNRLLPEFPQIPNEFKTPEGLDDSAITLARGLANKKAKEEEILSQLTSRVKDSQFLIGIPEQDHDIHDASALDWLAKRIER